MPKAATYVLIWQQEQHCYELYEQANRETPLLQGEGDAWFAWLATHTRFSFQGQAGQLNMLKEARQRGGEGYWYAYHRQGKSMHKKYAGRSSELMITRLEALARTLSTPQTTVPDVPRSQTEQLLEPKLRLPRLHATLVERSRLFALLDAGWGRRLTLLSAPAGFGKTTLARQWVANRSARGQFPPVAWVSLDAGDNDPNRFWRYVITACRTFLGHAVWQALSMLLKPPQPPFKPLSLEEVLTTFLNSTSRTSQEGILVLEDYHVISEPLIHETLAFLLDHLPATIHLVILSRNDPALPLARLRASGDLCEVHAADLRFSMQETELFLQHVLSGKDLLSSEELGQLSTRLEGWAAGLRLFTLALQGRVSRQEVAHTLTTFVGSHRTLQDYFITEVFAAQKEPLQHFLLNTSVLSRLNASLCDAVTGSNDGEQMLAMLDRAGLFLDALDEAGLWYRYHALFAEAMRAEARRRFGEEGLRQLSAKASVWYEAHDMLDEAIEAALQAQDMSRTAVLVQRLLEIQWDTMRMFPANIPYEFHTVYRWLAQIPESLLKLYPALCFAYGSAILFVFIMDKPSVAPQMYERFEYSLYLAEEGWRREQNWQRIAMVLAFRAIILRERGEVTRAVALARQALTSLSEKDYMWRALCLSVVVSDELVNGKFYQARKTALESYAASEATATRPFMRANLVMLSVVCFEQGELHLASEYYQRMLREAREEEDLDDIGQSCLGLSQLSYEWNDLATAEQQALEAFEIGKLIANYDYQVQSTLLLAQIEHIRGQKTAAQQRCIVLLARLSTQKTQMLYWLSRMVQAMQARLALSVGDHAAVQHWMNSRDQDERELPLLMREREVVVEIRWLVAQEKAVEALALLECMLDDAQQNGRVRAALEMQLLMIQAYVVRKQMHEARTLLQTVLERASGEGFLRLFLDEGATIATLLRSLLPQQHEPALQAYLQRLLQAFAQEGEQRDAPVAQQLMEPLSPQEMRVLRLLTTGLSNREIADELVVSVNTVRTQVQSIYRKLNVNNRVAAGETARQLHLL
ncbi:helix-turn-helix transcriptional regulator [Reticulibacter mediterranei]|uniref:Helix-turn-helix transcriptional regulator n=1 Tax=Reticulibacter mediterranei TaxID=2778369 RepID=A0A8J3IZL1_9CHLR|nr:LuxR C-terminal-related transcriptional regulator [Reticulibacter mediterranei]GHO98151.1 helix-turn-helix transcriptional regulator [Reticulibacter mediterranei]